MMLFQAVVDREDAAVAAEVHAMRSKLARRLRAPARWAGTLRRHAEARAISQSSAIEGYRVTDQDAVAAVDGQAPREAEAATWKEIEGYRDAMTFVMTRAKGRRPIDESTLLAAHFMLLKHDLSRRPGEYRQGGVVVTDGRGGVAYTAPDADAVPGLMAELVDSLARHDHDVLVDAAMAHLNLVKIHPFRDGNGRMSRILQTAVLAQEEVLEPPFASVEEWLGDNTQDYYRAIQATSGPRFDPERSADLWVKFNLRAHHLQAQTHLRRYEETQQVFLRLAEAAEAGGLPERVVDPLYEAYLGFTLTRQDYVRLSGAEARTATRDLALLVQADCLVATGTTKSRAYGAGPVVARLKDQIAADRGPLADPYPGLLRDVAAREAAVSP